MRNIIKISATCLICGSSCDVRNNISEKQLSSIHCSIKCQKEFDLLTDEDIEQRVQLIMMGNSKCRSN